MLPYSSRAGQPNVGKSSLMNALLGRKAVRASRTPGKTKVRSSPSTLGIRHRAAQHLQTHFWTNDIRLCDCPGLVCPSRAGLRRQVLAGVIPIQATEAVIAYVSSLLPLERILHLPVAKTTDDLLVAYAERNKYVTAKAGRADTSRAAAEIIRKLQGGAIRWAFRPPESLVDAGEGVWLGGETGDLDEEVEEGAEEEPSRPATPSEEGRSESESDSESEEEEAERQGASNAFALLSVVDA